MSKAHKKLTNKQIEEHLVNLYNTITEESKIINLTMKVFTDFVNFSGNREEFEAYLKDKYEKEQAEKKAKASKIIKDKVKSSEENKVAEK